MIARKLLLMHTDKNELHTLDGIIEALASKLFFHGHPINRNEAREIGLKVLETVPADVEAAMWDIFLSYEAEMKFKENFDAIGRLFSLAAGRGNIGIFTEIARFDETLTWAMVESANLSSRLDNQLRYTLTADPQLSPSMNFISLAQGWTQSEPAPPPAGG